MTSTLIILAHPHFKMSNINKSLANAALELEGVDLLDLYDTYPDMFIDIPREQKRLEGYENIILQFPFQWYSCPSLLKEWIDCVLQRGWAFGDGGDKLAKKNLICAVTTGGTKYSYSKRGHNRYSINDYLTPFDQTANMCGMAYHAPFVVYKAHHLDDDEVQKYGKDYQDLIRKLGKKEASKQEK